MSNNALTPAKAAEIVVETIMAMVRDGRPLMKRILPDDSMTFWNHYPDGDARDPDTKSRWYYHVHPDSHRDEDEHGHFHLFLNQDQLDSTDGAWSEPSSKSKTRANVVHVAALSIDLSGIPRQWMVTNRWITDEWLYPADQIIPALPRFDVDNTQEDETANRFLTAMVAMYQDEIAELLKERDRRFSEMGASIDNREPFQKGNDVMAKMDIDLDAKLESLGIN